MKKNSKKREAILEAICATKCHPTAEWVYNKVKPEYPGLSLGTVYRNIAMFKEEGKIVSVGVVNGQERFDGYIEPHAHFVCDACGMVIDVDEMDSSVNNEELHKKMDDAYGVDMAYRSVVFHGKCMECK